MTVPRADLSDLVHRYAAYLDDRQFDSAATLFTVEATLTVPDPPASLKPVRAHHGRQAITAAVAAVTEVTRTEHAIVGEVYGAGAREGCAVGRVTCIAHHWTQRPDGVSDLVWHLRYDDQYELGEDGWRISVRALTINAIETRSARRLLPREPG